MKKFTILFTLMTCLLAIKAQSTVSRKSDTDYLKTQLDFSKPIHNLGFTFSGHLGFAAKVINGVNGPLTPHTYNRFSPEFAIQYSCLFKNNFGFTFEIPIGIYQRNMFVDLSQYDAESFCLLLGAPYIGFTPKISYYMGLGDKACFQVDAGLKFMPFCFPNDYWISHLEHSPNSGTYDYLYGLEVPGICYLIPDFTISVQFLIHSKKKHHNNFLVGITGNLSFAKRMILSFDSYQSGATVPGNIGSPLPFDAFSSGKVICNSSSIGLTIGYRFMGLRP